MSDKLSVTFSPHIQAKASITCMTYSQLVALLPAVLVGIYYYGFRAIIIMVLSVLSAMVAEAAMQRAMGREVTVKDGTAALTGLLLALVLPVGAPWWAVIIGAAVAVILGKQLFGGLGAGPFNPVIVGWVVLRLSWPQSVETFYETAPLFDGWSKLYLLDTSELPLALMSFGDHAGVLDYYSLWHTLIGGIPGGIGSTSVIALGLGGLFLVFTRVVPWQIPVGYLGGLFVFALIFWVADGSGAAYANPLHHIIFGYTLIGAFFLAPDWSSSPYTSLGALLFGLGAGVLTMIIRYWGAYIDGVFLCHFVPERPDAHSGPASQKELRSDQDGLRVGVRES